MESEARCDKPRVAGGPDVLSESAASSRVETKCKETDPASSHLWEPMARRVVACRGRRRANAGAEGINRRHNLHLIGDLDNGMVAPFLKRHRGAKVDL